LLVVVTVLEDYRFVVTLMFSEWAMRCYERIFRSVLRWEQTKAVLPENTLKLHQYEYVLIKTGKYKP